jgi:hypothetical protein
MVITKAHKIELGMMVFGIAATYTMKKYIYIYIYIVVETKRTGKFLDSNEQPIDYMEELVENNEIDDETVYGLVVVGEEDLRGITQSIRGSNYRDQVRVVACSRLFDLLEIIDHPNIRSKQAAELLLPMETVDIGSLIQLITDLVQTDESSMEDSSIDPSVKPNRGDSNREESKNITDLLKENGVDISDGKVDLSNQENATETFATIIEKIIEEGFIQQDDLPYDAGGKKRYLINSNPTHKEGRDMSDQARQLHENFWLECHSNTNAKERQLEKIIEDLS